MICANVKSDTKRHLEDQTLTSYIGHNTEMGSSHEFMYVRLTRTLKQLRNKDLTTAKQDILRIVLHFQFFLLDKQLTVPFMAVVRLHYPYQHSKCREISRDIDGLFMQP